MAEANGLQIPAGEDRNEDEASETKYLVTEGVPGDPSIREFQSLVGSLLWTSRCTQPDISFAVHDATRQTHKTTLRMGISEKCCSLSERYKGIGGVHENECVGRR